MSLDDGCMFRRRRRRRRRADRRLSFGAMFFRGCDSDLRREKRDENSTKQTQRVSERASDFLLDYLYS